jgi:hypothetical protein
MGSATGILMPSHRERLRSSPLRGIGFDKTNPILAEEAAE